MRHHNKTKKFGRERNQRKALMKALAVALITRKTIKTTEAKAKALRPIIEKIITRAKKNDLASIRIISTLIGDGKAHEMLFKDVAPLFKERNGGYVRVIKLPRRIKDGSPMAVIEFVS